ncbi:MAG TPA: alpha-mannosyltransferase, partial [Arthrobacter sp.]|nr:alpha-mannosyltransferase [Arthrobacter sp.]
AHASVQDRTWPALCTELVRHYSDVIAGVPAPPRKASKAGATS